ncbi:MAG: bifunctional glutamate N-acetyltransferase/amino-acid acetyltransferase ArgJ [Gammaproteobacteria bacterium]|nr:bifunctional glutamate N-acetyltransferase/amino-acid acetyltransferase ArgJ [Gammaproteobacteria bacterium]
MTSLSRDFPLHTVNGIRLGATKAHLRYSNRLDLVVIEIAEGANTAALFTQNAFCAAPVVVAKRHLQQASPRYLLINTGFANAGLGQRGIQDTQLCCEALAKLAHVSTHSILPFSTGVIGEYLPVDKILKGLPDALSDLNEAHWQKGAQGILTTDTHPKGACVQFQYENKWTTLTGIAKGSGMICPNLATLLVFLATDLPIRPTILNDCLQEAARESFNAITIDGDTSTNDACVLIATGQLQVDALQKFDDKGTLLFRTELKKICRSLAEQLVQDGEGATKFIRIRITHGAHIEECRQVAYRIAHSPLVKTAFFASDPNWGRILAAIGASGLPAFDISRVHVWLNHLKIVEGGARSSAYQEAQGREVMQNKAIEIRVALGRGNAEHTVLTSDLSEEYIKINGAYRS